MNLRILGKKRFCVTKLTRVVLFSVILPLFIILIPTVNSQAESISIAITAQVAEVDDMGNFLGGAIHVGDTITGTYIYQSTSPDTNTLPTVGDYNHTTEPFGITINAGGFAFRTNPNSVNFLVEIVNNHGNPSRDNYLLLSYNNLFDVSVPASPEEPLGQVENHISWQLDDPTLAALSSDALPILPPVLTDWQSTFGLTISSSTVRNRFLIRAHVTDASIISSTTPTQVIWDADGDKKWSLPDIIYGLQVLGGMRKTK